MPHRFETLVNPRQRAHAETVQAGAIQSAAEGAALQELAQLLAQPALARRPIHIRVHIGTVWVHTPPASGLER